MVIRHYRFGDETLTAQQVVTRLGLRDEISRIEAIGDDVKVDYPYEDYYLIFNNGSRDITVFFKLRMENGLFRESRRI